MGTDSFDDPKGTAREAGQSAYQSLMDVVLTGIVVILPLVVTLYILQVALGFIAGALRPFVQILEWAGLIEGVKTIGFVDLLVTIGLYENVVDVITTITAVFILVVVVLVVGSLARFQYGEALIEYFDALVASIPGVGPLYKSFRQMGEVVLESGVENFRSVKLVEFPYDGVYVIGFETSDSAPAVMTAAGSGDMVTLFLPLAPNPVMGGFLAHIPRDRVDDVDMTVEEAVQTIITSGIATDEPDDGEFRELSDAERDRLGEGGTDADEATED